MADLNKIRQKSVPVLKQAGIIRSALFGSYVRGDQKEDSDIDFLVEFPKGASLLDAIDLQNKLQDVLGKDVDLVSYKAISPYLKESIMQNQYPIL